MSQDSDARRPLHEDGAEDLELGDERRLDDVTGGQDVTVNKAKTADKAFTAMDGYIRG
jgi:hypothetical protein